MIKDVSVALSEGGNVLLSNSVDWVSGTVCDCDCVSGKDDSGITCGDPSAGGGEATEVCVSVGVSVTSPLFSEAGAAFSFSLGVSDEDIRTVSWVPASVVACDAPSELRLAAVPRPGPGGGGGGGGGGSCGIGKLLWAI